MKPFCSLCYDSYRAYPNFIWSSNIRSLIKTISFITTALSWWNSYTRTYLKLVKICSGLTKIHTKLRRLHVEAHSEISTLKTRAATTREELSMFTEGATNHTNVFPKIYIFAKENLQNFCKKFQFFFFPTQTICWTIWKISQQQKT